MQQSRRDDIKYYLTLSGFASENNIFYNHNIPSGLKISEIKKIIRKCKSEIIRQHKNKKLKN
jgi:hypothetical protein